MLEQVSRTLQMAHSMSLYVLQSFVMPLDSLCSSSPDTLTTSQSRVAEERVSSPSKPQTCHDKPSSVVRSGQSLSLPIISTHTLPIAPLTCHNPIFTEYREHGRMPQRSTIKFINDELRKKLTDVAELNNWLSLSPGFESEEDEPKQIGWTQQSLLALTRLRDRYPAQQQGLLQFADSHAFGPPLARTISFRRHPYDVLRVERGRTLVRGCSIYYSGEVRWRLRKAADRLSGSRVSLERMMELLRCMDETLPATADTGNREAMSIEKLEKMSNAFTASGFPPEYSYGTYAGVSIQPRCS